jgi:hypothetical protein
MAEDIKKYNHVDLLFPSDWLKAADFRGQTVTVVIARIDPRVELERKDRKKEKKPVVYLKGTWKPWILNKTNARLIAKIYGNEIADWIGRPVMLRMELVDSFGEQKEAIRVVPKAPPPPKKKGEAEAQTSSDEAEAQTSSDEPEPKPEMVIDEATGEVIDDGQPSEGAGQEVPY